MNLKLYYFPERVRLYKLTVHLPFSFMLLLSCMLYLNVINLPYSVWFLLKWWYVLRELKEEKNIYIWSFLLTYILTHLLSIPFYSSEFPSSSVMSLQPNNASQHIFVLCEAMYSFIFIHIWKLLFCFYFCWTISLGIEFLINIFTVLKDVHLLNSVLHFSLSLFP